jgi:hypothetical protein
MRKWKPMVSRTIGARENRLDLIHLPTGRSALAAAICEFTRRQNRPGR